MLLLIVGVLGSILSVLSGLAGYFAPVVAEQGEILMYQDGISEGLAIYRTAFLVGVFWTPYLVARILRRNQAQNKPTGEE